MGPGETAVAEAKRTLRREMLHRLRGMDAGFREAASRAIAEQVTRLPAFRQAGTVHAFLSLPEEVRTAPLLEQCIASGKQVLVPFLPAGATTMAMAPWTPEVKLQRGALGIRQPSGAPLPPEAADAVDLVIVPGLAFDRNGHRLGRGKGHYDRLLTTLRQRSGGRPAPQMIGVAFSLQVVDQVPTDTWDVTLDGLVDETLHAL